MTSKVIWQHNIIKTDITEMHIAVSTENSAT